MGEYFRDVYDHLSRLNQSIDSIRDMVTTAMTVHLSLSTMQENETTKRLAAYGALVAVPTMIAGVYGMNFENMPELRLGLRLPGHAPDHGGDRRLPLLPLPQGRLAVDAAPNPAAPAPDGRTRGQDHRVTRSAPRGPAWISATTSPAGITLICVRGWMRFCQTQLWCRITDSASTCGRSAVVWPSSTTTTS